MKLILLLILSTIALVNSKSLASIEISNENLLEGDVAYQVNYTSFRQVINPYLDTNLDVYAPDAAGSFPVLYFITGVGGIIPATAHSDMLTMIASCGFVAVGVWKMGMPTNSFDISWFEATIDFVENRLENSLRLQGYNRNFRVDYLNSFIGCHSAGCHVSIVQLKAKCANFVGMVLMSPVDGADPFGILDNFVITPGEKVNFTIPTLQIVTGFDPIPGPSGIACAPQDLSSSRFFDAMNGPTWFVNATKFGHNDLFNPTFEIPMNATMCPSNPDELPREPYIQFLAGQLISFMTAVLDPISKCDLFDTLEISDETIHNGVHTENVYAANGWQRCTLALCSSIDTLIVA